ncbi:MAG TPA: PspA/IM30 family protein [Terricaulis sp.]|nr:PspA/IM30 family protein [Terricaulis sp.]
MSETLVARVKRLISGGVNSLVDAVENASPELVMREAIREVDQALDEVRDELGLVIANKHHANKRLMAASAKHEDLTENVGLAVAQGRDDLAEAAIARQLDIEAQLPVLESALHDTSARETELEGYIVALQARKREMEEDLAAYLSSREVEGGPAGAGSRVASGRRAEKKADKAQGAFNRVLGAATGVAGTPAIDRQTATKLAELEQVKRENRIRERLAAAKALKAPD